MKKLGVVLAALLAIAALPMMAQSNYHYNENMNCSDCHSMHASAHNNLTDGTAITAPNTSPSATINPYYPAPNPGAGNYKLLKAADVCSTCHDGQTWAPDVIGDNVNGYIRSAGGVREGTTGGGHKIGSVVAAPGYDNKLVNYFPAGTELECVSCHSPHGGAAFRNLGGHSFTNNPDNSVRAGYSSNMVPTVAKAAAFDATKDVTIVGGNTYTFGGGAANFPNYYGRAATVYSRNAAGYTVNGVTSSNRIDQFCGVCHGAFHGGAYTDFGTGLTDFVRHPTSVVVVADGSHGSAATFIANKGDKTLKVYQAAATVNGLTDSPGCLSCHKAHGNNNPFGLIFPDRVGGTIPSEEGGGVYKDLCKSCHGMGGA